MRISRFFARVENKIFLIIVLTTLASSLAVFSIMFKMSYMLMVDDVHTRTASVNAYAQREIPLESFYSLNAREDENLPVYAKSQELLDQIRQVANVRYLFTAKRNAEGKIIYLIDGLPRGSEDFRFIGDIVEDEILPDLNLCFAGKKVDDDRILNTSWGAILLTCWPKFDDNGNVAGAIVMEYDAEALYQRNFDTMLYSVGIALVTAALFIGLASLSLRKVSETFYKRLAYTDVLTGLNSRTALECTLDSETENLRDIVVVACDLNNLKYINDCYGHAAGDNALRKMADVLRELPFDNAQHYRVGGDEFVTLVRGENAETVQQQLTALRDRYRKPEAVPDCFDFSFGVAAFDSEQDAPLQNIIARADADMYAFKRAHSIKLSADATKSAAKPNAPRSY